MINNKLDTKNNKPAQSVNSPRQDEGQVAMALKQMKLIKPVDKRKAKQLMIDYGQMFNQENEIKVELIEQCDELKSEKNFNFTGLASATDYTFYRLAKHFINQKIDIHLDRVFVKDCPYITIWSLQYLFKIKDKSIFDLVNSNSSIISRVSGCDLISEGLLLSFQLEQSIRNGKLYTLFNQAKVVVINEEYKKPFLVDLFVKKKPVDGNKSSRSSRQVFKYGTLKLFPKTIHIYDTSECISDLFLSERNLVILTFETNSGATINQVKDSIFRRLLKVLIKNIVPASILCLCSHAIDRDALQEIQKAVYKELNRFKVEQETYVEKFKNLPNLAFQCERQLSSCINLIEQIELLRGILNFASLSSGEATDLASQIIETSAQDKLLYLDQVSQKLNSELDELNRSELLEIKSLKSPPNALSLVADAICLLFSKQASFSNFIKLAESNDFINNLKQFKKASISDYTRNELKNYVSNENFTRDYISKISNYCGILCAWVRLIYEYAAIRSNTGPLSANNSGFRYDYSEESNIDKNYSTLKEYIRENAFYGFSWIIFDRYLELYSQNFKSFNEKFAKVSLKSRKLLNMDEYFSVMESSPDFNDLKEEKHRIFHKYMQAEALNGNFLIHSSDEIKRQKDKYLFTDPKLLADVLSLLSSSKLASKSNVDEKLSFCLGENVIVWQTHKLKDYMKQIVPQDKVDFLIQYLYDLDLILKTTDSKYIVPVYLMNYDPEEKLKIEWSKKWENGYESTMQWDLMVQPPSRLIFSLIHNCYDQKKTILAWRTGLVNKETCCDVLVRFHGSRVELAARMIDVNKILQPDPVKSNEMTKFFKLVYFEYYINLMYLLTVYNIPFKPNISKIRTNMPDPHLDELLSLSSDDLSKFSSLASQLDKAFWHNEFYSAHRFTLDPQTQQVNCYDCSLSFEKVVSINKMASYYMPTFDQFIFKRTINQLYMTVEEERMQKALLSKEQNQEKVKVLLNGKSSSFAYKSKVEMNLNELNYLEMKFLDNNCNDYDVFVGLDLLDDSVSQEYILIKLNYLAYDTNLNFFSSNVKVAYSALQKDESTVPDKSRTLTSLKSGDILSLNLTKLGVDDILRVSLNDFKLIELHLKDCFVHPRFVIISRNPQQLALNYGFFSVPVRDKLHDISKKKADRDSLSSLINMRIEARDRLNPNLAGVASITQVDEEKKLVLVHFDGWDGSYDYWCPLDDPDIFPCGFMNFMKQKDALPYKDIVRFDPPPGDMKTTFEWEEYLEENKWNAVPFDFFSPEQKGEMTILDFKDNLDNPYVCYKKPDFHQKLQELEESLTDGGNVWNTFSVKYDQKDKLIKRGILVFPSLNTEHFFHTSLHTNSYYFGDKFLLHFSCLNEIITPSSEEVQIVTHLLDSPGIYVDIKLLTPNDIKLIMISSYYMLHSLNQIVAPSISQIFPGLFKQIQSNEDSVLKILSQKLKDYFYNFFTSLAVLFNTSELEEDEIIVEVDKFMSLVDSDKKSIIETECLSVGPLGYQFSCASCDMVSSAGSMARSQLLDNKYSYACQRMDADLNANRTSDDLSTNVFDIDTVFTKNYKYLKYLILANCKIQIDENSADKISNNLQELILTNNFINQIPAPIYRLNSLESLTLINNPIVSFDPSTDKFENLTKLSSLEFNNLKLDQSIKNKVSLPAGLKRLIIKNCSTSFFPFTTELCSNSLQELVVSGIPWVDLTNYGGNRALLSPDNLMYELNTYIELFSKEQVKKINYELDINGDGFLNFDEIVKLNAFIFKHFSRFQRIPSSLFLTNLVSLDFSYQAIKVIPDDIEKLVNLKSLYLNYCILLENLSAKCGKLDLNKLELTNCWSLKTPPPEVVKRGFFAIMAYLKRLASGSVSYKKTKLMLVGLGQAGKTSLFNALSSSNVEDKPDLTDGINIKDWVIKLPDKTELTYSMWDFAGQSVYYNTHQFFLSSRAVYLLVWNVRLGSEYAGLEFWLSSISCHAPNAPIFIVGTHIDQVSKFTIDQDSLKAKFKQIEGFYFVSNKNKKGIEELKKKIIETTLMQTYIGEKVPEVWLNFANKIKEASAEEALISMDQLSKIAESAGIVDKQEMLQAIRFLSDLGSVQYFEISDLKDKVIIQPQWIVDCFASLVSVKDTSIEDGKLYHKDIAKIWENYTPDMHQWILKLTEEFDLTFAIEEQKMSIVPCMLPEKEPAYVWPELNENDPVKLKEMKIIYSFDNVPNGLFNRAQVRLYELSNSSIIWKKGSFLTKNNHIALFLNKPDTKQIQLKVQGVKPENIVFLIHEVIESLINESFKGIKYDYSFPCIECVDSQFTDPAMFSSHIFRKAHQLKAPYIQCHTMFHTVSIQEMLAIMPIEGLATIDMNLEYSLRDLKKIKSECKYDVAFWYCAKDLPKESQPTDCISPLKVIDAIKAQDYKLWYPIEELGRANLKMDKVTYALKESKMVILGLSDNFALDEQSLSVFELVKQILKKKYMIVEFGKNGTHKWLEDGRFASVCCDVRVIMQDPKRFSSKLVEVLDGIERQIKDVKSDKKLEEKPPDLFISYCWANSHDAIKKGSKATATSLGWVDPRALAAFFEKNGISTWLDIDDMSSSSSGGVFGEITKGLNKAKVVVACLSDEYVASKNCSLEFRFAHVSLKLPIIKAIVGLGQEWKKNEIAFLAGSYPEVSFQTENQESYAVLLSLVQKELEKAKPNPSPNIDSSAIKENKNKMTENNHAAFQELYELTQRKFLKQIDQYCGKMTYQTTGSKQYPRLYCVDFIDSYQVNIMHKNQQSTSDKSQETKSKESSESSTTENKMDTKLYMCIRPMCEYDSGWHLSDSYLLLDNNTLPPGYAPYLARIMNLIKNGDLAPQLKAFTTPEGQKMLEDIESKVAPPAESESSQSSSDDAIFQSYSKLRSDFIDKLEKLSVMSLSLDVNSVNRLDLKRGELRNGKMLWMCPNHISASGASIVAEDVIDTKDAKLDLEVNKMLSELDSISINII